ncbi:DNA repair protein RecO [Bacteroidota bacterium]
MYVNSKGIVLSTLRYSDSTVIARVYTEAEGLKSFMVRTGKGKPALMKMALLQPLSVVALSFNNDPRKGMTTPKSLEREEVLGGIPFDTVKTCIALFIAEVIGRSIKEEEHNPGLFRFLKDSIILLDKETKSVVNFHLKFMIEFSGFLGFYPQTRNNNEQYFDLSEGEFSSLEPFHPYTINAPLIEAFDRLMRTPMQQIESVEIGNEGRRVLLQKLIDYYRLHLEGMREITSHKILEEILT